jgi:anti-sigma factor RsiW
MKVTRDVITDLLPIYVSGEASADTHALVEEFFKQDPAFARLAQDERSRTMLHPVPLHLPPEHEKATLARTKRLLRWRTNLFTYALMFTAAIFATMIQTQAGGLVIKPALTFGVIISVLLALAGWIGYFVADRRLRVTGL